MIATKKEVFLYLKKQKMDWHRGRWFAASSVILVTAAMTGLLSGTAFAGSNVIAAGSSGNAGGTGPGYAYQNAGAADTREIAAQWQYQDGSWYFSYLRPDGSYGRHAGGWLWIDGYCYYFHEDGRMAAAGVTPDGWQVSDSGAWMEHGAAVYMPGKGISTRIQAGYGAPNRTRNPAGGGGFGGGGGSSSGGSSSGGSSGGNSGSDESIDKTDSIGDETEDMDKETAETEGKDETEGKEESSGSDDDQASILQKRLENWQERARQADYAITGIDNPLDRSYLVHDQSGNDQRMKHLVSMISDPKPHEFYMIGVDYQADTLILGQTFREQILYSHTIADSFNIHGVTYTISRIGIQKIQSQPEGDITDDTVTEEEQPSEGMHYSYGDTVARKIGSHSYRFRCIDEDYRDASGNYRRALFLCDTVIRSDVEADGNERRMLKFGSNNNYKKSDIRKWLNENTADSQFPDISVSVGVNQAYGGHTEEESWEQFDTDELREYPIDGQKMNDRIFLLSVEEAMDYAEELWRFEGSEDHNPEDQYSPYSKGYYLRTPLYEEDESGEFCYGDFVYIVDLLEGNIHAVDVSYTTIGLRPAFVLENE